MIPKVETIIEAKVRKLVNNFKRSSHLTDDDPILVKLQRDCLFALRMGDGKRRAKEERRLRNLPLFKGSAQ